MTGSRPFDLDTAWLPREEIDDDDDDDDDGLRIDEGGVGHGGSGSEDDFTSDDSSDKSLLGGDERLQQEGLRQRSRERNKSRSQEQREIPHGALNTFAFFKTAGAPFLVGKVREERVVDGEREVSLHWYTPSNRRLVDNAGTTQFDKYAKAVFTPDFLKDTTTAGGSGRPKLVPDASWEQVSTIVATCPALIAGGRKIPSWVKEQLKEEAPDTDGDDDISAAGKSNVMVGGKRKARAQDTGAGKPEEDEEEEEEAGARGGTGAAEQQQRRQQQQQQTAARRPRGLLGLEAAGRTSGPKAMQVERQRAGRTPGIVEVERPQSQAGDDRGGGSKSRLGSTTSRRVSSRGRRPRKWLGDGDDEDDRQC